MNSCISPPSFSCCYLSEKIGLSLWVSLFNFLRVKLIFCCCWICKGHFSYLLMMMDCRYFGLSFQWFRKGCHAPCLMWFMVVQFITMDGSYLQSVLTFCQMWSYTITRCIDSLLEQYSCAFLLDQIEDTNDKASKYGGIKPNQTSQLLSFMIFVQFLFYPHFVPFGVWLFGWGLGQWYMNWLRTIKLPPCVNACIYRSSFIIVILAAFWNDSAAKNLDWIYISKSMRTRNSTW